MDKVRDTIDAADIGSNASADAGAALFDDAYDIKEKPASKENEETEFFSSAELTDKEKQDSRWLHRTTEQLQEIKQEINEYGNDPKKAIVTLMKNARVLGLGESHVSSANLGMITDSINKLKEAGATHLAVEMKQEEVDTILKTGKPARPGWNSDELANMILTAHKAGLKVIGADNKRVGTGYEPGNEQRDQGMAESIANVLNNDANAKVIFVVGSSHLCADGSGTAAEILKDKFGAKQIATVVPEDNGGDLQKFSRSLTKLVAVHTQDTPNLAELPMIAARPDGQKYGQWDMVIAYPSAMSDPDYPSYKERQANK